MTRRENAEGCVTPTLSSSNWLTCVWKHALKLGENLIWAFSVCLMKAYYISNVWLISYLYFELWNHNKTLTRIPQLHKFFLKSDFNKITRKLNLLQLDYDTAVCKLQGQLIHIITACVHVTRYPWTPTLVLRSCMFYFFMLFTPMHWRSVC